MSTELGGTITSKGFVPYARHPAGYTMPVRLDFQTKERTIKPPITTSKRELGRDVVYYVFVDIFGRDYLVSEANIDIKKCSRTY